MVQTLEQTKKNPRVGVAVLTYNNQGEILLGKRTGACANGQWGTPGGKLEFGESIEACARRELLEEAGLELTNLQHIGITAHTCEGTHWVTIFVAIQTNDTPQNCEPEKCAGWQWFNWNATPKPLMGSLNQLVQNHGVDYLQSLSFVPVKKPARPEKTA